MSKEREILKKILMLYREDKSCMSWGVARDIEYLLAQPDQDDLTQSGTKLQDRIKDYLSMGGLFNPELVDHGTVRDLILDARAELDLKREPLSDEEIILAYRELVKRAIGRFTKTKPAHGIGVDDE